MASFSSPGLSDTTSRVRLAARRRARREQERQAKVREAVQSKRRGHRVGAGRQVVNDILKERQLLREARDAADATLKRHDRRRTRAFANENARNQQTVAAGAAAGPARQQKPPHKPKTTLPKLCRTPADGRRARASTRAGQLAAAAAARSLNRDRHLSSPGNRIDYKQIRKLGHGSFGSVVAAKNLNDGKVYALKTICYRGAICVKQDRERALKEVHALRRLSSHCCVVGLHDAFESTDSRKLHIVAEFCESGSLETRLNSARRSVERNGWECGKISERIVQSWMFQLCGALEHLHKHHTLHRDLKPANIFLCNGGRLVKLGDFGLVNVLESSLDVAKSNVGTPCYNLTPELLRTGGQSKAADMWSLGVCLIECCTLEQPFVKRRAPRYREGGGEAADKKKAGRGRAGRTKAGGGGGGGGGGYVNSIVELGKAILGETVDDHPRLASYSQALRKACSHGRGGCLSRDPSERPTASGLLGTAYFVRAMERFLRFKDHLNACPADLSAWLEARVVMAKMEAATAIVEEGNATVS
jgi:serine/threonine protein kinase